MTLANEKIVSNFLSKLVQKNIVDETLQNTPLPDQIKVDFFKFDKFQQISDIQKTLANFISSTSSNVTDFQFAKLKVQEFETVSKIWSKFPFLKPEEIHPGCFIEIRIPQFKNFSQEYTLKWICYFQNKNLFMIGNGTNSDFYKFMDFDNPQLFKITKQVLQNVELESSFLIGEISNDRVTIPLKLISKFLTPSAAA